MKLAILAALLLAGCNAAQTVDPPTDVSQAACNLAPDHTGQFINLPSGQFLKGAYALYPEEAPELLLHVEGFAMLAHEVTNAEFARFVDATGYVTSAEKSVGRSHEASGSAVFSMPSKSRRESGAWRLETGANWRAPEGAGSGIAGRESHPVVHVSLADARAYAVWAGGRLPTEEEWEYAASIGLPNPADTQSGAYTPASKPVANTWQGFFPLSDEAADGFSGRAPVGCFAPSEIGLYDIIGNVWEWTDTAYDDSTYTVKGGSYLCADNFCRRYRPAARQPQEADFSSGHIGFRIVRDL